MRSRLFRFQVVLARNLCVAALGLMALEKSWAAGLNESFSDKIGFRKCLQNAPFSEKKSSGGTTQEHYINKAQIRERCVARAVNVISTKGTPAMAAEFLQEARKGGGSADYYDLIAASVAKDIKLCNDRVVYDEIVKLYSYPGSSVEVNEDMSAMAHTIKTCLKDKEFKADFIADANGDQSFKKNVCKHLAKEGVIQCR